VVAENFIRNDTSGTIEQVDAKYELLQRGQYVMNRSATSRSKSIQRGHYNSPKQRTPSKSPAWRERNGMIRTVSRKRWPISRMPKVF
jgi:hypothetical protein